MTIPSEPTSAALRGNADQRSFARLPRPQKVLDLNRPRVPTKSLLMQAQISPPPPAALPAPKPPPPSPPPPPPPLLSLRPSVYDHTVFRSTSTLHDAPARAPFNSKEEEGNLLTLGKFVQDSVEWLVRARRGRSGLVMVKNLDRVAGMKERNILEHLKHTNIVKLAHAFCDGDIVSLGLEYCRFTIGEILHVHLKLEVQQVQHIARSVFDAIAYLASRGIVHQRVGLKSIRIAIPDLRVVLSNFEHAIEQDADLYPNTDLIDLGLVLLECMEGRPQLAEKRSIEFVKSQRALNRVFGLSKPERWSDCKQLMDFLDNLFSEDRAADLKIAKRHQFISPEREDWECMRPYVELVTLECFTVWTAGE